MKKRANSKHTNPSAPVWAKGKGGNSSPDAELCIGYCAGRDVAARPMADEALIPYDLRVNRAHCAMLCKQGIISARNLAAIERALQTIEKDWREDAFKLEPALEDVHINVERAVALLAGETAAGVMHTARSRNDQTATDIRLGIREELLNLTDSVAGTTAELARLAARLSETVMGGWTHGQPAMPTTLGHWAAGHAFALSRDLNALMNLWPLINQSPLGAAAGFGTSWPIDRNLTAAWLGFDAPQANSLDAVSTRWECEARFGSALAVMMTHLSSLGQDLYYLSSPPRRLIELDPAFTTGSSIMPQKRNPDFAEVTRSRAAAVQALVGAILSAGRAALSGYNRDSQWTKYWIMDLVWEVGAAPKIFERAVATMKVNAQELERTASEEFVSAVDLADHLALSRKIEFRRLYHLIGEAVTRDRNAGAFKLDTLNELLAREGIHPPLTAAELAEVTHPKSALHKRSSLGGPSP
ncbi:argininosuccinate lyase, partial [Candidatus Sumerlaeota bacterium]|nr:argininosuccinate lyase [Candidatus Sumerlaeota bacterium]